MLGATQEGFSATIRKIKSRTCFDVCCLPTCFLAPEIAASTSENRLADTGLPSRM